MKYIQLNNSHEKFIVDDEDEGRCLNHRWSKQGGNEGFSIATTINRKTIILGRFLLNYDGLLEVDHRDRNWLNNQKENLRICTHSQNLINTSYYINNTSNYKGVDLSHKKWRARIQINKKTIYLGSFTNKEDAARAYNKKAKELFGEFAWLNRDENGGIL